MMSLRTAVTLLVSASLGLGVALGSSGELRSRAQGLARQAVRVSQEVAAEARSAVSELSLQAGVSAVATTQAHGAAEAGAGNSAGLQAQAASGADVEVDSQGILPFQLQLDLFGKAKAGAGGAADG